MRKRTDDVYGIRLSMKNRIYLERLGILDGRNGTVKKVHEKTISFNEFVNKCMTIVCESDMNPRNQVADSDELRTAWIRFRVKALNAGIMEAQEELIKLSNQMPKRQEIQKAVEKLTELELQ